MKCYKNLFSKGGIKSNIACFSIIPIIIFHFITFIIFYTIQINSIKNIIKDISFGISNWESVEKKEKEKKKKSKNIKKQKRINKNKSRIENKNLNTNNKRKKPSIINSIVTRNNDGNINQFKIILNQTEQTIKKVNSIMEYNNEEKNTFSYELALKYDSRTFCEYYISLIRTKHSIIFSFYTNTDYNSKIIKIDLFFINFLMYYTINALFFSDNTMHKIYEDEGSFNFIYQLPQIFYSSLISGVLNVFLKILALSEKCILDFKKDKNKSNLTQREIDLNNKLRIKFILYFIFSFILLLFFWYYLSMFGAIYVNTQSHLIKDTLISFGLSMIYPFGIYLLPGFFRIPALSNKKNKRDFLYKLSQVFQML